MSEPHHHPLESGAVEREAREMLNPETGRYEWMPALRVCDCGRRATHTVYNERNTMSFICDLHTQELIDEADSVLFHSAADSYDDLILVEGIEETADERRQRLTWQNLLANGATAQ